MIDYDHEVTRELSGVMLSRVPYTPLRRLAHLHRLAQERAHVMQMLQGTRTDFYSVERDQWFPVSAYAAVQGHTLEDALAMLDTHIAEHQRRLAAYDGRP